MEEKTQSSCRFTWTIENFSKLTVERLYSDIFYAGGYKWRVLILLKGNDADYLSVYLDAADSATLPNGWSREAQFSLSIINQINRDDSIKKETQHVFNASESNWGFTSFIPLSELNCSARGYILHDTCIVEAEVKLCGLDEEELKTKDKAEALLDTVIKEPTVSEADTSPSSFAEVDILFSDIQNLLNGKSSGFQPPQFTNEEIANAKETFKQCLNMNLANVIKLGRASEFKNSLSIMLIVNAFPSDMSHEMTKFLANFDRNRETYVSAQQDLREAKEKQNSVSELKAILKELSLEFVPIRNRANQVDQEVAKLERQLAERKEKKVKLKNNLEDLAGRASTSRQALINAEREMKLFMHKKEQAEEMIRDIDRLWESLKKKTCFKLCKCLNILASSV